MECSNVLQHNH